MPHFEAVYGYVAQSTLESRSRRARIPSKEMSLQLMFICHSFSSSSLIQRRHQSEPACLSYSTA
jgi:hypothetical protein